MVTEDIQQTARELKSNGIAIQGPERISFKACFGLVKKTLPWRLIYLPAVPRANFEIGFIQYDPDPQDRIKQYLVPNADKRGIQGCRSARVQLLLTSNADEFLHKIFPQGEQRQGHFHVALSDGGYLDFENMPDVVNVSLLAEASEPKRKGNRFQFMNVAVQT